VESALERTVEQLNEIMRVRDTITLEREYGGVDGIAKSLGSDIRNGIQGIQVEERRTDFGKSITSFNGDWSTSWFQRFIYFFKEPFMTIFFLLSIFSIVFGVTLSDGILERRKGWIEGVSLLIGCLFVCVANASNEWQKARKYKEIYTKQETQYKTNVIRDGRVHSLLLDEIVVGDVLELVPGDYISCDGIIIDSFDLVCEEGEGLYSETSLSMKDKSSNPFVFSGSVVKAGYGRILVTAVGMNSDLMKSLLSSIRPDEEEEDELVDSKLQIRLKNIAGNIWKISIAFSIGIFLILFGGWTIRQIIETNTGRDVWKASDLVVALRIAILSFSVFFVCSPKGIYKIITTSLSYSSRRTIKDNILFSFHRLPSVTELLAYTSQVFVDTDALCKNSISVVKSYIGGEFMEIDGENQIEETLLQIISSSISINSRADIKTLDDVETNEGMGNRIDIALLLFLKALGVDYHPIRKYYFDNKKIVEMSPLYNGQMSTVVDNGKTQSILYTKGNYEAILNACTHQVIKEGVVSPLEEFYKYELLEKMNSFTEEGYKVLAVAYKEVGPEFKIDHTEQQSDMVLIALLIMVNPIRPGVFEIIQQFKNAGICVRLVTGENVRTAKKTAFDSGILTTDGICLEGSSIRYMAEEDVDRILPNLQVVACAQQKELLTIIQSLQARGEHVTYLASRPGDLSLILAANVGAVKGVSGAHISKKNSDVMITDDDIITLFRAICWGRALFYNIQKYMVFHMTINIVVMIFTAITSTTSFAFSTVAFPPFNSVQLLWVHIIMDIFASLSLASDPPHNEVMFQDPIKPRHSIVTKNMKLHITGQIIYQIVMLTILHYVGRFMCVENPNGRKCLLEPIGDNMSKFSTVQISDTIVFNTFIFCQLFNEINCRRINNEWNLLKSIHRSLMFVAIFALNVSFQVLMVQVGLAGLVPLNWYQWLLSVGIGFFCIPYGYFLRFIASRVLASNRFKKGMERMKRVLNEIKRKGQSRTNFARTMEL